MLFDPREATLLLVFRELRSRDPALHDELTELAARAVAAHRLTRDPRRDQADHVDIGAATARAVA